MLRWRDAAECFNEGQAHIVKPARAARDEAEILQRGKQAVERRAGEFEVGHQALDGGGASVLGDPPEQGQRLFQRCSGLVWIRRGVQHSPMIRD